MREIATDIRIAIINAISPLTLSGVTLPVYDSELPPTINPANYVNSAAYVLITDQNET